MLLLQRFLILLLFSIHGLAYGQNHAFIDSLRRELFSKNDTALASAYNDIAWEYRKTQPDSAKAYVYKALALANKNDYEPAKRFSIYMLGIIHDYQGDFDSALYYYNLSYSRYKEQNDEKGMASALNNIGAVYNLKGQHDKALDYYFRSLRLKEKIGDIKGTGSSYNNIGIIYERQKQFSKALEFYNRSLEVKKKLGNKEQLATTYSNISGIYQEMKKYETALAYADSSVKMHLEIEEWNGLSLTYNSIANIYLVMGEYELSLKYNKMALELQEKIGDKWAETYSIVGISQVYLNQKNYKEAIKWSLAGVEKAREVGARAELVSGLGYLSDAYMGAGNLVAANKTLRELVLIKDSFMSLENQSALAELQTKYEVSEKEKKIESLNKEKIIKEKEAKEERLVRNSVAGIALVIFLLAVAIFVGYRNKKRANEILQKQKDRLNYQNRIIEEKNRQIGESIEYARYIQDAALPSVQPQQLIRDSFLLYLPKDVVSGDFYWFGTRGSRIYLAAADCTGHGIPGAFMSLIGTMILNEIFNEKKISKPSEILELLNQQLKRSLKQTDESFTNRNGMDIALCCLDIDTNKLEYAGANRPLWILREKENAIETCQADKTAIGGHTDSSRTFTNTEVKLDKGDAFYIFSDGFADQFGGKSEKKLTTRRLKEVLIDCRSLSMEAQRETLLQHFLNWKGSQEQVDDVLIIGARIS